MIAYNDGNKERYCNIKINKCDAIKATTKISKQHQRLKRVVQSILLFSWNSIGLLSERTIL